MSDGGVAALYERTEGWAAGLRLAVISLSGHADPERFVAEFSGTDRAIGEYLMAEMLERQPSEVQSMLLRTSLVDRLNGELADLLAGRSGSERMLLELEDAERVRRVAGSASARGFATTTFWRISCAWSSAEGSADEVPDLHRRAARWFADHGEAVEAVRHTLAAGDWPDAAPAARGPLVQFDARRAGGNDRRAAAGFPGGRVSRSSGPGVGSRGG